MNNITTAATSAAPYRPTSALLVREVDGQYRVATPEEVLSQAWTVLADRVKPGASLSSPQDVKDFLRLEIGHLEHEVFGVVFVDSQHRLIEMQQMFRGTVSQTSVYPREVVKEALKLNAAAVILFHCHPSGLAEPSRADESALSLVDVRVLDHLIVGHTTVTSMAERGLI